MKCSLHPDNVVSRICMDENILCCVDCVVDHHKRCEAIVNLRDEGLKFEGNARIRQIKEQLEKMASQVKALIDLKKSGMADIKQKSEVIINEIREIRTKVNTVLDAVEENVGAKAKAFAKNYTIGADDDITKLGDTYKKLQGYIRFIDKTETVESSGQMSIVLEKLMSKMDIEATIQKFVATCTVHEIELKIGSILEQLLNLEPNDISQAASVTESVGEHPIPAFKAQQLKTKSSLEKVAEYEILPKESNCINPDYYTITYRKKSEGLFLVSLCSNHKFCCLTEEQYRPVRCLNSTELSGTPFNAAFLKNGEIAISIPEKKKIVFLSELNESNSLHTEGHINTKFKPKALYGLRNGDIAVSWNEPVAFGILRFTSLYTIRFEERVYFQHDSAGRLLKTFDFMAVDEKKSYVIQLCTEDKAVYCFDFEGTPRFKYSHADLVFPHGTSISGDGNIFVCDEERSVIHVISPEGHGLHVIREGCPEKPLAIAFDKSGMQFAVSQKCSPWKIIRIFRLT